LIISLENIYIVLISELLPIPFKTVWSRVIWHHSLRRSVIISFKGFVLHVRLQIIWSWTSTNI